MSIIRETKDERGTIWERKKERKKKEEDKERVDRHTRGVIIGGKKR
jgi:hypothetical protein